MLLIFAFLFLRFAVGVCQEPNFGSCQERQFEVVGDKCYLWAGILPHAGDNAESLAKAIAMCKEEGGVLPMLKTAEELDAFRHYATMPPRLYNAFMGIKCNLSSRTPMWLDGTPITYSNYGWDDRCSDDLFVLDMINSFWFNGPADSATTINIFCQESHSAVTCQNSNFDYVNGTCYGMVGVQPHSGASSNSLAQSIVMCKEFNAVLPMPKTQEEEDAFWAYARKKIEVLENEHVFMGMKCRPNSNAPMWADGTTVSYSNFGNSDNFTGDLFTMNLHNGYWYNGPYDSAHSVNVFCQGASMISSEYQCDEVLTANGGWVASDYCVKATYSHQNWVDALTECKKDNGSLPIIKSTKANDFFVSFAHKLGISDYFPIGLNYSDSNWAWADDRSTTGYSHFVPEYPILEYGKCVYMDVPLGMWMNADCNSLKSPSLCQRIKAPQTPVPTTCTYKLLNVGDHFYSPGYPSNSNTTCDYVLQAPAGYIVELQIVFFDGNAGDELIADDGTIGGTPIASVTGFQSKPLMYRSKKPQMWVHWSPRSGHAVGFHAIFQAAIP